MELLQKKIITISLGLLLISQFFIPISVDAQARKTLKDAESELSIAIPATGVTESEIDVSAANVVKGILAAMALVFFGLMVYAGIVWMTARGEEDRITKARETIIAAIIGLLIVVAAYAVTNFLADKILVG